MAGKGFGALSKLSKVEIKPQEKETEKPRGQETQKTGNQETQGARNLEEQKTRNLENQKTEELETQEVRNLEEQKVRNLETEDRWEALGTEVRMVTKRRLKAYAGRSGQKVKNLVDRAVNELLDREGAGA